MKYSIQSKRVVYNTLSKTQVTNFSGKPGEIIFDSVAEFNCYLILKNLNLPIEVHRHNPAFEWKLDFTIKFIGSNSKNNLLLTKYGYSLNRHDELFVEYKGVLDESTIARFGRIPQILRKSIIIVTPNTQTISYYDKLANEIINLPSITVSQLSSACNARK